MIQRPASACRGIGDGEAPHTARVSSSRRKTASPVGSVAKGVRRFSRLLPSQVNADPTLLTIVPKPGFASTFDHGSGVSRSPSSTRSEEHTSELQSHSDLVCRLLLEKKKKE